ncbi:MAG: DNA polymerase III subunit delta' [Granulosicoccus sp.]|nr:DNA polymerase III subunit delta' [Granulosicoccus sp.]
MMGALTPCPPWLLSQARQLLTTANANRLHHALLLAGVHGIGKSLFAQWLAESLLCRQRTAEGACGECDSCRQVLSDAHPDLFTVRASGASATIKVDEIRELLDWMQLTAGVGSYRIALVHDADTLNRHAANSLLKTLEEPAAHAVIVLCATQPGRLPATVRSRCQALKLMVDDEQTAVQWLNQQNVSDAEQALAEAGYAPLLAVSRQSPEYQEVQQLLIKAWTDLLLHQASVGKTAESLAELELSDCLSQFSQWCLCALKESSSLPVNANADVLHMLSQTQGKLSDEQWFTLHERLLQLHRVDSASFKAKTVLEGLFADIRLMINS